MTSPLISVIIPVYNAFDYIETCIQSVLHQDMDAWVAILVDDGSTDGTQNILEHYSHLDERIHLVRQENQGASAARNAALAIINTPYFFLLDADDRIPPDALRCHLTNIEQSQSDISLAQHLYEYGEGLTDISQKHLPTGAMPLSMQSLAHVHMCGWNKLYKTEIIRRYHLQFDTKHAIGEDVLFVYSYLAHCNRLAFYKKPLYYHTNSTVSVVGKCARGKGTLNEYQSNLKTPLKVMQYAVNAGIDGSRLRAFGYCMLRLIFIQRDANHAWFHTDFPKRRKYLRLSKCYQREIVKLLPISVALYSLLFLHISYACKRIKRHLIYRFKQIANLH